MGGERVSGGSTRVREVTNCKGSVNVNAIRPALFASQQLLKLRFYPPQKSGKKRPYSLVLTGTNS